MPLRNDPPRPPDGVGRQAIRTTPPTPTVPAPRTGLVGWVTRNRPLMVATLVGWLAVGTVDLVAAVVGGWSPLRVVAVGCAVGAVVATATLLVASRSGSRS